MNKKILKKRFEWQKSNSQHIFLFSLLIAWGFGAKQIGVPKDAVFIGFVFLMIFLGFSMIYSKSKEIIYGEEISDKRINHKKGFILRTIGFIFEVWMGILLIGIGVYLYIIYLQNPIV